MSEGVGGAAGGEVEVFREADIDTAASPMRLEMVARRSKGCEKGMRKRAPVGMAGNVWNRVRWRGNGTMPAQWSSTAFAQACSGIPPGCGG